VSKLNLDEALRVSAEARALLGSAIGPTQQEKARNILDGALDALAGLAVEKPAAKAEKPKKSEGK
jgi:hypothetical protein